MLKIENLYKTFNIERGEVRAVNHVGFEVPEGKLFTLLGPSGCGKTTTLRCIAGLEHPEEGIVSIGGTIVSGPGIFVPPNKRNIGMVFQSYAIWPHMSVADNVAFPLRVGGHRYSKQEIEEKVRNALQTVELAGLERRPATNLSGGQQQRLALARALVREPSLLLLDEPLSNLDAKLREQMRVELRRLQQRLGITTVYVTHDQVEALAVSDIIAVMQDGQIQQMGSPREIYQKPGNQFVAGFVGTTNWLEGRIVSLNLNKIAEVETQCGKLICTVTSACNTGDTVLLSARPDAIEVTARKPQEGYYWEASVESAMFLGEYIDCFLRVGEQSLRARVHPRMEMAPGSVVYVQVSTDHCVEFARS